MKLLISSMLILLTACNGGGAGSPSEGEVGGDSNVATSGGSAGGSSAGGADGGAGSPSETSDYQEATVDEIRSYILSDGVSTTHNHYGVTANAYNCYTFNPSSTSGAAQYAVVDGVPMVRFGGDAVKVCSVKVSSVKFSIQGPNDTRDYVTNEVFVEEFADGFDYITLTSGSLDTTGLDTWNSAVVSASREISGKFLKVGSEIHFYRDCANLDDSSHLCNDVETMVNSLGNGYEAGIGF